MATKARQQYDADEISLQKQSREFSIADGIQQKIDSIETGAQVNVIETVKVNGTALVPDANKAVNVEVPEVIDNLYTIDSDNALSAKQGKLLYDYIQNIASRGRFLSNWNSATGLPMTNPSESPYPYKSGDYFVVSNVAGLGGTNYRPDGSSYIIGQASTVVETDSVDVSDFYFYDGTTWLLLKNSSRSGAVDSSLSTTSTNPVENRVVTNAINGKQNTLTAGSGINIDANNEISNTLPGPTISSTAPSSPIQGMEWYDTTNDQLKVYDGTNWNIVGDDAANINTKTFYLSSTSDLTNAQAALDWYNAGKNAIICYDEQYYIYNSKSSSYIQFYTDNKFKDNSSNSYTTLYQKYVQILFSGNTVTSISQGNNPALNCVNVLMTGENYSTPYTPQYNGSPATKKYVDDGLSGKQATLVNQTNIKSINNESLLGSGNITVGGEIGVSTDTGNLLTAGDKLWFGSETDFSSIVSPASDTMYIQYVSDSPAPPSPGRQPSAHTLLYIMMDNDHGTTDQSQYTRTYTTSGMSHTTGPDGADCYSINSGGIDLGSGATSWLIPSSLEFTGSFWVYDTHPLNELNSYTVILGGAVYQQYYISLGWFPPEYGQYTTGVGIDGGQPNQTPSREFYIQTNDVKSTWTLIGFTIKNGVVSLYRNGVLGADTTNVGFTIPNNGFGSWHTENQNGIRIGCSRNGNDKMSGYLGEVVFEDVAWDATAWTTYFDQTKSRYGIS